MLQVDRAGRFITVTPKIWFWLEEISDFKSVLHVVNHASTSSCLLSKIIGFKGMGKQLAFVIMNKSQ